MAKLDLAACMAVIKEIESNEQKALQVAAIMGDALAQNVLDQLPELIAKHSHHGRIEVFSKPGEYSIADRAAAELALQSATGAAWDSQWNDEGPGIKFTVPVGELQEAIRRRFADVAAEQTKAPR